MQNLSLATSRLSTCSVPLDQMMVHRMHVNAPLGVATGGVGHGLHMLRNTPPLPPPNAVMGVIAGGIGVPNGGVPNGGVPNGGGGSITTMHPPTLPIPHRQINRLNIGKLSTASGQGLGLGTALGPGLGLGPGVTQRPGLGQSVSCHSLMERYVGHTMDHPTPSSGVFFDGHEALRGSENGLSSFSLSPSFPSSSSSSGYMVPVRQPRSQSSSCLLQQNHPSMSTTTARQTQPPQSIPPSQPSPTGRSRAMKRKGGPLPAYYAFNTNDNINHHNSPGSHSNPPPITTYPSVNPEVDSTLGVDQREKTDDVAMDKHEHQMDVTSHNHNHNIKSPIPRRHLSVVSEMLSCVTSDGMLQQDMSTSFGISTNTTTTVAAVIAPAAPIHTHTQPINNNSTPLVTHSRTFNRRSSISFPQPTYPHPSTYGSATSVPLNYHQRSQGLEERPALGHGLLQEPGHGLESSLTYCGGRDGRDSTSSSSTSSSSSSSSVSCTDPHLNMSTYDECGNKRMDTASHTPSTSPSSSLTHHPQYHPTR